MVPALLALVKPYKHAPIFMVTLMILNQVSRRCRYSPLPHRHWKLSTSRISIDVPVGVTHETLLAVQLATTCFPNFAACIAELSAAGTTYKPRSDLSYVQTLHQDITQWGKLTDMVTAIVQLNHPFTGIASPPPFCLRHLKHLLCC